MASSHKKVIVRRFSPGLLWGYLPSTGFLQPGQPDLLHLLDLSGRVQPVPLADVKYVCFVRDFNPADTANPERLLRKTFLARPRPEGLWVRLSLRDSDRIEGLAPIDLALADGWVEDRGIQLTPPDIRGNTQRMYVPRTAINGMEVLAVVTAPSRRKPASLPPTAEPAQPDLFSLPLPPNARTN